MKKILSYSCIILLLAACSKKKDDTSSSNTWHFENTDYTAAAVVYVNGGSVANLTATANGATASDAHGLTFTFTTPPTGNSQMLITSSNDPNTILVTASILSGSTTTFYSNDVTTVSADVTLNNGKVGVSFPGTIWLHNDANYNDSTQLSMGTLTQQ